jgi:hypothetical protein
MAVDGQCAGSLRKTAKWLIFVIPGCPFRV